MVRIKKTPRKLESSSPPESPRMTWVFYMLYLNDIGDKLDIESPVTANKIYYELFQEVDSMYEVFGLDDEPNHKPHITVGVQKKDMIDTEIDAYILIGLKVPVGVEIEASLTDDMKDNLDYWLCKEDSSLGLDESNLHVVQGDAMQVEWLEYITLTMEDGAGDGNIDEFLSV